MIWINCKNGLPGGEYWEFFHYRYASDHIKLDANLFEIRDGGLMKKGGTGRLEFNEVEFLFEMYSENSRIDVDTFDSISGTFKIGADGYPIYEIEYSFTAIPVDKIDSINNDTNTLKA